MYFRIIEDETAVNNFSVLDYSDDKYDDACLYSDLCTKAEYQEHPNKYIVGDIEEQIKVYEYEKKTIEVPIYNEEGEIIGYEPKEVDDYDKPIMIEDTIINPETGEEETILVHKFHYDTVTVKGLVLNPDFEQEEATRREAEFNKAFFNTSLGYIRRSVTMADGSHKDFLSDLLPVISMGVQAGQAVNILAYDKPPFDEDVTDWTEYQHQKIVTAQFIQECFMQLSADFAPINRG